MGVGRQLRACILCDEKTYKVVNNSPFAELQCMAEKNYRFFQKFLGF